MSRLFFVKKSIAPSSTSRRSYSANGTGFPQTFVSGGIPTGLGSKIIKAILDYAIYGFSAPKPRISKHDPDHGVLQLELPTPGLNDTNDIKMVVDVDNHLQLTAQNDVRDIFYLLHLDLPRTYNFEKATINAKLRWGMTYVNIKNFKREDVRIRFD